MFEFNLTSLGIRFFSIMFLFFQFLLILYLINIDEFRFKKKHGQFGALYFSLFKAVARYKENPNYNPEYTINWFLNEKYDKSKSNYEELEDAQKLLRKLYNLYPNLLLISLYRQNIDELDIKYFIFLLNTRINKYFSDELNEKQIASIIEEGRYVAINYSKKDLARYLLTLKKSLLLFLDEENQQDFFKKSVELFGLQNVVKKLEEMRVLYDRTFDTSTDDYNYSESAVISSIERIYKRLKKISIKPAYEFLEKQYKDITSEELSKLAR